MRYCCKLYEYTSNSVRNGIVIFQLLCIHYISIYIYTITTQRNIGIEIEIYTIQKLLFEI